MEPAPISDAPARAGIPPVPATATAAAGDRSGRHTAGSAASRPCWPGQARAQRRQRCAVRQPPPAATAWPRSAARMTTAHGARPPVPDKPIGRPSGNGSAAAASSPVPRPSPAGPRRPAARARVARTTSHRGRLQPAASTALPGTAARQRTPAAAATTARPARWPSTSSASASAASRRRTPTGRLPQVRRSGPRGCCGPGASCTTR